MPNWIEGTLKLRGNSEDLKLFFWEGLEPSYSSSDFDDEQRDISEFVEYDFGKLGENDVLIRNQPHIIGTNRAFILDCNVYWGIQNAIICMPIKQAWSFTADDDSRLHEWERISKRFNLDIRLYGFERGARFCEEVEIIKGKTTIYKIIEYNNWDWECPMPLMGG